MTSFNSGSWGINSISVPSDRTGTSIPAGQHAQWLAITPDATTALVVNFFDDNVTVLDVTRPSLPGYTVPVGNGPVQVAITPDGSTALVTNFYEGTVSVLDLTKSPIGPGYVVPVGDFPFGIAITPNGKLAVATNFYDGIATVLELQPSVQVRYTIPVGGWPYQVAMTPNGTKAIVTLQDDCAVALLDLTRSPIQRISTTAVGSCPQGVAITSDGTKALVANTGDSTISVLDLTKPIIGQGSDLTGCMCPQQIVITPDGKRAYVTASPKWEHGVVAVLDLTKTPIVPIHLPIGMKVAPWGIAITPDQAPTSVFTTSVNGLTVSFDGSGSSSPVGAVREYLWNFGDTSDSEITTGPAVSHTYAKSGVYTVTLTVVNDAGTSLDTTFTGQTVSNRGLPRARSTQTITLDPCENIDGVVGTLVHLRVDL